MNAGETRSDCICGYTYSDTRSININYVAPEVVEPPSRTHQSTHRLPGRLDPKRVAPQRPPSETHCPINTQHHTCFRPFVQSSLT